MLHFLHKQESTHTVFLFVGSPCSPKRSEIFLGTGTLVDADATKIS